MHNLFRAFVIICAFTVYNAVSAEQPKEILWEDLVPEGWVPEEPEGGQSQFLDESGPAAVQSSLDAPVVSELDQQYVKIPGFILPVEFSGDAVSEFLLVPYVGACLHVPPPPPNQIVHVRLKEPLVGTNLYDPVWVEGTMQVETKQSQYAQASYTLDGDEITEYEW